MIGPCTPYFTREELVAVPGYCAPGALPPGWDSILDSAREHASEVMYVLMGRQFPGACSTTRWPVRRGGCYSDFRLPFDTLLHGGAGQDDSIPLWYTPRDIEVEIDGDQFEDWKLLDGHRLTRVDGKRWPGNDLTKQAGDVGTFTISWVFGAATPGIVKAGALEIGVQLLLDWTGDARCKLPQGTTGLNRQGQSIQIDRDVERVREAGPSLQSVMVATAAFNPTGARQPPDVWSPDHIWELVSVEKPVPAS